MWTYQASWMHLVQPTNETPQYQKIKKWPSQNKSLACRTSTEHVAATNIVYRWFFNNGLFPTLSHILAAVFNHLPSAYFTTWLMLSFNIFLLLLSHTWHYVPTFFFLCFTSSHFWRDALTSSVLLTHKISSSALTWCLTCCFLIFSLASCYVLTFSLLLCHITDATL